MDEKNQGVDESELKKAIEVLEKGGYAVVHPFSLAAKPCIRELSDVLEAVGYRLDEAKIERNENCKQTGRILFAVYMFRILEKMEREGDA
jgi:hypothetical protein